MSASADISKFLKSLEQEVRPRAEQAASRAIAKFGQHVIGDAQQLTPVETGALQASATVEAGWLSCTIGFNTDYAAAVHERLDVHHDIGQAKFLETAIRNNIEKFAPFVINEIRKVL